MWNLPEVARPVAEQRRGGVQSVDRAFELLEVLADAGGELALSEIAAGSSLPLPTIHRLVRTLVNRGYVRQPPSRRYALGPRLINLGERASGRSATGPGRGSATWSRRSVRRRTSR